MRHSILRYVAAVGLPRLIIAAFLLFLLAFAWLNQLPMATLVGNSLTRIGMNGILALAMVPSVQAGVGLNFGLPLGAIAGLLGILVVMEVNMVGFAGLIVALVIAVIAASAGGCLYGYALNKCRGQEMMVGTYASFSVVAGMCIFWEMAPFHNSKLMWAVSGKGLRTTLALDEGLDQIIDGIARFRVLGIQVPFGLLGTFAASCALILLFSKTRWGTALRVAGTNPALAASCGVDVDRMRILGTVISTVIAAVGMVVYSQSLGLVQLYNAPLMMAFPAVAAVLIGGATAKRATVGNAVLGTVLFQTLLTVAAPVTRIVFNGDISEVARLIISNGMIMYALAKEEGNRW